MIRRMTREEAIREIEKIFEPAFANYIITALTEGATVSDKEPTTKNDLGVDCISRKAAEGITWQDPSYTDPLNILTEVRDKIRELPSVTPQEPKTGHWYRQTNDYVDYYECSECGMAMGLYDVKNYCPNCGSRNEVEE